MSNLFSVFDPQANFGMPINWVSALVVSFLFPCSFWLAMNQSTVIVRNLLQSLHQEFSSIVGSHSAPGLTLIPISLFVFIALNNFMGLFPFIFTASSHLTFTVAMAFPLWVGHMIMGIVKTPQHMLAHLVPLGTPPALMPFMVMIELVSNIIRPLTLSVRLAANMVAGHLLLTLLGNQGPLNPSLVVTGVLLALVLLATLETAVSLIQAYVFSVLSTLYFNEVNLPQLS